MAANKPAGEKRPVGRPPKTEVDPRVARAICANLELSMPLGLAAECEGVARATVYEWIERFPEFSGQITRARALGAKKLTKQALEGGKGSSAANWHLERRFREDYSPPREEKSTSEVKVTIEGGLPSRTQGA